MLALLILCFRQNLLRQVIVIYKRLKNAGVAIVIISNIKRFGSCISFPSAVSQILIYFKKVKIILDSINLNIKLEKQTIKRTLAKIFVSINEKIWLNQCPAQFKPMYYRCYVDDTFAVFSGASHVQLFLYYLNTKHNNIKFTMEHQENDTLSFLNTNINILNNKIETSIYRKPTFSGFGLSFFSSFTTQSRIIGAVQGAHSQLGGTIIPLCFPYAPGKYDKRFGTPANV